MSTQKLIPIQSDSVEVISKVQKVAEFIQFAQWLATPAQLRKVKNQKEFADAIGVCEDTLTDWKKCPQLWNLVQQHTNSWMRERVPDVIEGLYTKACEKGSAKEVEMFLRLAGKQIN